MAESSTALPDPLVTSSPARLSGEPVFAGTRVPVKTLFDYLETGNPLEEFLIDFPNVSRAHATAVLELARSKVAADAMSIAAE